MFSWRSIPCARVKRTTTEARSVNAQLHTLLDQASDPRTTKTNTPAMSHCTYHQKVIYCRAPVHSLHGPTPHNGTTVEESLLFHHTPSSGLMAKDAGSCPSLPCPEGAATEQEPGIFCVARTPVFSTPAHHSPPLQVPSRERKRRKHCQSNR